MKLYKALPALILATLLLAACGQTGPLYLPESETSEVPVEEARQDAVEDDDGQTAEDNTD